jgi:hypothetical protein
MAYTTASIAQNAMLSLMKLRASSVPNAGRLHARSSSASR